MVDAGQVIASAFRGAKRGEGEELARGLVVHAAAMLTMLIGPRRAAEACYHLADALATQDRPTP